jgi:hypothetical protein
MAPVKQKKKVSRGKNNGQKCITSVFGSRLLVRLRRIGINFYSFSMNVDVDARDNHPFVAIMALPNPPEADPFLMSDELPKAQSMIGLSYES